MEEEKGRAVNQKFVKENSFWLEVTHCHGVQGRVQDKKNGRAWDDDIKNREPEAMDRYREKLEDEMDFWKFLQFRFFKEWNKLKKYVNGKGIQIIGDIPIYVARDSADVWATGDCCAG